MTQDQHVRTRSSVERWSPELYYYTVGGRCKLLLADLACGDGRTLPEAADDLVAHVLTLVLRFRSGPGCGRGHPADP